MSVAPARGLRDEARVGARWFKGKTWSLCRGLLACWLGKVTVEGGGCQRGGSTKRGGCVAACRPAGAGKSVLKAVGANVEGRQSVVVVSRLSPAAFSISHVIPW